MDKKGIKRIGLAVLLIGAVTALIGGFSCAMVGVNNGYAFEFIKALGLCAIGGLLCWLGGEVMSFGADT